MQDEISEIEDENIILDIKIPKSKVPKSLQELNSNYSMKSSKDLNSISVSGNKNMKMSKIKQVEQNEAVKSAETCINSFKGINAKFITNLNNKIFLKNKGKNSKFLYKDNCYKSWDHRNHRSNGSVKDDKIEVQSLRLQKLEVESYKNFTNEKQKVEIVGIIEEENNEEIFLEKNEKFRTGFLNLEIKESKFRQNSSKKSRFRSKNFDYEL